MDYQFIRNEADQVEALFSEDYIVLGYFLSDELKDDISKIDALLQILELSQQQVHRIFEWQGVNYRLLVEECGVSIATNSIEDEFIEELPESTALSDMDQCCEVGLIDFFEMLEEWRLFCAE